MDSGNVQSLLSQLSQSKIRLLADYYNMKLFTYPFQKKLRIGVFKVSKGSRKDDTTRAKPRDASFTSSRSDLEQDWTSFTAVSPGSENNWPARAEFMRLYATRLDGSSEAGISCSSMLWKQEAPSNIASKDAIEKYRTDKGLPGASQLQNTVLRLSEEASYDECSVFTVEAAKSVALLPKGSLFRDVRRVLTHAKRRLSKPRKTFRRIDNVEEICQNLSPEAQEWISYVTNNIIEHDLQTIQHVYFRFPIPVRPPFDPSGINTIPFPAVADKFIH
ncbi:hypothetical protein FRC03_009346 [Tulasnella sp. 419]|nr:hypothetical protein FRC03_009346 [Tulasnella sp. 419]